MPQIIRSADMDDYEELLYLFSMENGFHAELVPQYVRKTDDILRVDELRAFLADPKMGILVCEDGGALSGAIIVTTQEQAADRWTSERRCGYIEDLIVREDARGKGIGKALVLAAREWAESRGLKAMELHVWAKNSGARRLYESLGFEAAQQRLSWEW